MQLLPFLGQQFLCQLDGLQDHTVTVRLLIHLDHFLIPAQQVGAVQAAAVTFLQDAQVLGHGGIAGASVLLLGDEERGLALLNANAMQELQTMLVDK